MGVSSAVPNSKSSTRLTFAPAVVGDSEDMWCLGILGVLTWGFDPEDTTVLSESNSTYPSKKCLGSNVMWCIVIGPHMVSV